MCIQVPQFLLEICISTMDCQSDGQEIANLQSWWFSMIQQRCLLAHCSRYSKMSRWKRRNLAGALATQVSYIAGSYYVSRHIVLISTVVAADDLGHCSPSITGNKAKCVGSLMKSMRRMQPTACSQQLFVFPFVHQHDSR